MRFRCHACRQGHNKSASGPEECQACGTASYSVQTGSWKHRVHSMPCPILCAAKVTLFNCALGHSQKSINRYTAKAKLCFCKNNKRRIIKPHAGSQDNGNGKLLLRSPTATRPPSFGIRAESGVPLGDFQLLGPAVPASPEVRHPYPASCHGAAHQELVALQGKVLRQRYAGTRFDDQRQLHLPQKHKATASDSTLRVEMNNATNRTRSVSSARHSTTA